MPVEEFGSYDPAELRPGGVSVEDKPSSSLLDDDGNELPLFDDRRLEDFEGLLYIGALTCQFEWLGHRFVIRTLTQDEILTVATLIKPWMGTIGEIKAYSTAMVSLCVVSVDGQSLPMPIGEGSGEHAWAYQRFNYVKSNWFQFTIDKVYGEYLNLEAKADSVVTAMEKASGSAGSTGGSNDTSAEPSEEDS